MTPQTPNLYDAKDGTPLENGAQFDISHDTPEHMVPAGEYFDRQRELAQLAKVATEAAEQGSLGSDIKNNIAAEAPATPEQQRLAAVAYISAVSQNLVSIRGDYSDRHWNLENAA